LPTHELLASLLVLAFIEAAIGLLYFMHLKYEKPRLSKLGFEILKQKKG